MRATRATTFVLLLALPVLAPAQAVTRDAAPVSYRADIQPLFNTQCVFCHVVGAENGEQDLSRRVSHTELMQPSSQAPMPRVTPGDPKAS